MTNEEIKAIASENYANEIIAEIEKVTRMISSANRNIENFTYSDYVRVMNRVRLLQITDFDA